MTNTMESDIVFSGKLKFWDIQLELGYRHV